MCLCVYLGLAIYIFFTNFILLSRFAVSKYIYIYIDSIINMILLFSFFWVDRAERHCFWPRLWLYEENENELAKIVIKSHAFQLDHLSVKYDFRKHRCETTFRTDYVLKYLQTIYRDCQKNLLHFSFILKS